MSPALQADSLPHEPPGNISSLIYLKKERIDTMFLKITEFLKNYSIGLKIEKN